MRDEGLDPESRIYFHSCENKCSCSWSATPYNFSLGEKLYRPSLRVPHESQAVGFLSRIMKIKNRTGVGLRFSLVRDEGLEPPTFSV